MLVSGALHNVGHDVVVARSGADGFEAALDPEVALVVLDLMLPGMDGLEICRRLRPRWPELLLMLTARSSELDRVVGLELGADDYLTKPFSLRELQAASARSSGAGAHSQTRVCPRRRWRAGRS